MNPFCDYMPSPECLIAIDILSNLRNAHMCSPTHEVRNVALEQARTSSQLQKYLKELYHITGGIAKTRAIVKKLKIQGC